MKKALPPLTLALALLAACGGGSSTPFVSIDGVTPGHAQLQGYAGLPAPNLHWSVRFIGDLSALQGQTVYIGVAVAGGPAYGAPSFWVSGANTLEIVVTAAAPEPAPAHYTGTATLYLCLDAGCTKQLGRSPWQTAFTTDIAAGIQFSQPALALEASFGVVPAPGRVDVTLPAGAVSPRISVAASPPLRVTADGTAGFVASGALAPAGSYAATATVEVGVPDPNGGYDPVTLRATLPVSYTVLPDPAKPFLITPDAFAFTVHPTSPSTLVGDWRSPTLVQQVAGGWYELVETRYLEAPAGATASALAVTWTRLLNGSQPAVSAQACTGYAGSQDCLPPGAYRSAVRARYHPASGDPAELDLAIALTVEPGCDSATPDFQSDLANCGACFRRCGPGFACNAGACECGGAKTVCGGGTSCHDLATEKSNCGACGVSCGGALACTGGACCPAGLSDCGGACVDERSDRANCGACGHRCADVYACFDGVCGCGPGKALCPYTCIDVTADPRNCGACGVTCNAQQTCQAGQCTCPAGLTGCGGQYGACVALPSDPANCGACGVACGVGETCSGGACSCPAGSARCGGGCVDLASDAWHCGACGAACPAGQTCAAGGCADDASAARMLGVDAAHSGVNAGETGVPPAALAWSATMNGCGAGPAVVEGGRVLGFGYRTMHGHAVTTGAELWRRDLPGALTTSCPALSGGVAYLDWTEWTGTDRVVHLDAIDVGDGRVLDTAVTNPSITTPQDYLSPLVVGGALYLGGGGDTGGLLGYGLSPALAERFAFPAAAPDGWAPGWAAGAVHTVMAGTVRAHDPVTGAVAASRDLLPVGSTPTASGTPVFGAALGYVVTSLPYSSILSAFTPGTLGAAWSVSSGFKGWPAVSGDELYVVDSPSHVPALGQLQARDALTGAIRWTFEGDGRLQFPPVIAAGYLYVASDSNVYAVDLATHQQVWTAPTGGYLTVAEGMLLVNQPFAARLFAYRLTR